MSDERRQEDVPMDRLTRLADAAVTALERAPEYVEATDKAVILVDDDEGGGLVRHGYEDGPEGDMEVAHALLEHARAIHAVHGIPFTVAVVPRGEG